METVELHQLELQLEQLLQELDHLRAENHYLRQQLSQDTRRHEFMGNKNQLATEKLKKVIKQLREAMS